ncbi:MAG: hypothetical protein D6805_03765 [Planctomycetota bacterium]|nr:MAG: hypothetical protein D6805_03765 [Planctomycetota bacterium]
MYSPTFPKTMRKFLLLLPLLPLSLHWSGCCIRKEVDYSEIPEWIHKIPLDDKYTYAVGFAAPAVGGNMQMVIRRARDKAISKLAQIVSYRLYSNRKSWKYSGNWEKFVLSKEYREILTNAKINAQEVANWFDKDAKMGEKMYYVLMKIPLSNIKTSSK